MITVALRAVIGREAWLRPGGAPGTYVCRLPELAPRLASEPWIASAEVSGGFLTVTVTHEALIEDATEITVRGSRCAESDVLRGQVVTVATSDWLLAGDWERARAVLAVELTGRLAAAAGATVTETGTTGRSDMAGAAEIAAGTRWAGRDAMRFALARMVPGGPAPDPAVIARHVLGNPAYAVRYAHAVAAAVLRWAGTPPGEFRPRQLTGPGHLTRPAEMALLDVLSWLPERVAVAARRGRPDEFARYLETLASRTIDIMHTGGHTSPELLWLAAAARTGLGAGLALLGISAPERLLVRGH
jgi:arginyl-tRNA synthetase